MMIILSGCKPEPVGQPITKAPKLPLPCSVWILSDHRNVHFKTPVPEFIEPQLAKASKAIAKQPNANPRGFIYANNTTPIGDIWHLKAILTDSGITNVVSAVCIDGRVVGSREIVFEPFFLKDMELPASTNTDFTPQPSGGAQQKH